ncbi:transcriptional regulator [Mycobacterium tuberculosis]|nr:transcriptional regulator [Mycobacterium tuberculosis]COW95788.1 transcriptional regulator [Mycobacterium tuberculosis]
MPIQAGVGITRMDLLERGRYDLVLALASTHTGDGTVEYVLNETDKDWRETVVDNAFESYTAEDGVISIRPKR